MSRIKLYRKLFDYPLPAKRKSPKKKKKMKENQLAMKLPFAYESQRENEPKFLRIFSNRALQREYERL